MMAITFIIEIMIVLIVLYPMTWVKSHDRIDLNAYQ